MQSIIHLENIRKNYYLGKQVIEVLKGISLDIFKNEYVALIGQKHAHEHTRLP
jgi:putative ABC transport system ATP-binding protein